MIPFDVLALASYIADCFDLECLVCDINDTGTIRRPSFGVLYSSCCFDLMSLVCDSNDAVGHPCFRLSYC
jgi:hypothetical protein